MQAVQEVLTSFAWWINIGAVILMLAARFTSNKKSTWALVGVILLIISMGNATILASYDDNIASQLAALFGTVVHGALGATFVANWLSDGAT